MKVSIICTNYNKGEWIAEAMDSFLRQKTEFPFEIIVVDDASTDQSPAIIKDYQERYPDKIQAVFHETNKGIAKTWVEICQLAKGDYIARCDGDDYWTDDYKLQKQVNLLESQDDSKWSNTDFDFVTAEGEIIYDNAIQNNIIPPITDVESLISQKGMTMSSTWLVDRLLMLEVNRVIDVNAADDTFDIQIELFKRTNLTFLPESTTVYRMGADSDSRPIDDNKFIERIDGLLSTQLNYIDSIDTMNFKKMTKLLVKRDAEQEKRLHGYISNQQVLESKLSDYIAEQETLKRQFHDEQQKYQHELSLLTNQVSVLTEKELELNLIKASRTWKIRTFIVRSISSLLKRSRT